VLWMARGFAGGYRSPPLGVPSRNQSRRAIVESGIPAEKHKAIVHFVRRFAVPIYLATNEKQIPVGTGTLFAVNGGSYLITAAHVARQSRDAPLAVPTTRAMTEVITLGSHEVLYAAQSEHDVSVIALHDKAVLDRLWRHWSFIQPRHLDGRNSDAHRCNTKLRAARTILASQTLASNVECVQRTGSEGCNDHPANANRECAAKNAQAKALVRDCCINSAPFSAPPQEVHTRPDPAWYAIARFCPFVRALRSAMSLYMYGRSELASVFSAAEICSERWPGCSSRR